ncbi:MAG: hypothetical protein ABIJ47_10920 [Candidatus Bathyarchaeota archaeon]
MNKDRKLLLVVAVAAMMAVGYLALTPIFVAGANASGSSTAGDSTPYGENLEIHIGSGAQTSGQASVINFVIPASWLASLSDEDTQNVYAVNATYKSQEVVTMSYSLSVTYSNVNTIAATVKVKAIDKADASMHEYTIANAKSISGASPIADNGNTQPTITQHLTDITASATSASVKYQIYCLVTGTGTVSGDTLTATVEYTDFGCLSYVRSTEASNAEVTPTVSVASWVDDALGLPNGSALTIVAIVAIVAAYKVVKRYR